MMNRLKMQFFNGEINTTYDLTPNHIFQTNTDIGQVPNDQLLQRHTESLTFSLLCVYYILFFSSTYIVSHQQCRNFRNNETRLQIDTFSETQ